MGLFKFIKSVFVTEQPEEPAPAAVPVEEPKPEKTEPEKKTAKPSRRLLAAAEDGFSVEPLPGCKLKSYRVAGTAHYQEGFLAIAQENPAYLKARKATMLRAGIDSIPKYTFGKPEVQLVPEPDNPADPNAIKVLADGQLIGYIKSGTTKHIHNVLNDNRIERIQAHIYGGDCKALMDVGELGGGSDNPADYILDEIDDKFRCDLFIDERQ